MADVRLDAPRRWLRAWWNAPAFRVALAATAALRVGAGIFIAALLIVAPGPYAASWAYVFHQPAGIKIATLPGPALTGPRAYLTTPWTHWDAVYYLQLATRGYRPGEGAFLPLHTALAHVVGAVMGGHFTQGALLVSTVATFFTLLLLHRLAWRLGASESAATWAVIVAAALIGLAGLLLTIRRLPPGLWLTLAACWCVALIKVDAGGYSTSAARYLLALLPLAVLLGGWLARAPSALRVGYLVVSVGLFGYYFGQWLLWGWVS